MLHNEKYKGDALLQKTYTVDFLTKKRDKNNGQTAIPQSLNQKYGKQFNLKKNAEKNS